jgi:DNA polymerase-3 subunit beta
VSGDHVSHSYQSRFLTDALRPFARRTVITRIQPGLRATEVTSAPADEDDVELRYLVVPMRPADDG